MSAKSANFQFLHVHDQLLVRYGAQAERYFSDDPNTALIKLRQFAEVGASDGAHLGRSGSLGAGSAIEVRGRGASTGNISGPPLQPVSPALSPTPTSGAVLHLPQHHLMRPRRA